MTSLFVQLCSPGDALVREIREWDASRPNRDRIGAIFFGVSHQSPEAYASLLDIAGILKGTFEFDPGVEITLEVHAGTRVHIDDWLQAGITRISIRSIESDGAPMVQALAPYFSVSVDVCTGSQENWKEYIMAIAQLPLHHISITFEPGFTLYAWTVSALEQCGLMRYEIMNFARSGHRCAYSMAYWQRRPYKGFGVGAHSSDGTLTRQDAWMEELMFGLAQVEGISWDTIRAYVPDRALKQFEADVHDLAQAGYVKLSTRGCALTLQGCGVIDDIIVKLAYDIDKK